MDCAEDARALIRELSERLRSLLALIDGHTGTCSSFSSGGEPRESPAEEKDFIARRLGRTRAGLESYVVKYRARFGQDPPWVVRKPGLPWLPDVEVFEAWRKTTEGDKAVPKRKRRTRPKNDE